MILSNFQEIRVSRKRRKKFCFLCRSQSNSLVLILGAYVFIFLIASVILIASVLKLHPNVETGENGEFERSFNSSHANLKTFKEFTWPYKEFLFNCSNLRNVKEFKYLTSGWTKNVFSFQHGGKMYALKTVNGDGVDMKNCREKESEKVCYEKATSKMYKEYILSRELAHSNIVQVLAWCVNSKSASGEVGIIAELCSPVDLIMLLRMTFRERLKIMLDLSKLMAYLSESPLGSVAINDFQRQQFVMCNNTLKLTDLDDLSIEEPKCTQHRHCLEHKLISDLMLYSHKQNSVTFECSGNSCIGFNEKKNVLNTFKHFVNLFLNITTPDVLQEDVNAVFTSYTLGWSAKEAFQQTEVLYNKYNLYI